LLREQLSIENFYQRKEDVIMALAIKELVHNLHETVNTKGWDNPEFEETLINLNREWKEAIVPRRPYIPNMPQANGSTSGGIARFPKTPSDPCKP